MRVRQWIARAHVERENHAKTWFCTLTFREAPGGPLDCVDEWQRFAKRLRKGLKAGALDGDGKHRDVPPARVRYLYVVEAGDQFGRWHLHALIHGDDITWFQIRQAWKAGHIKCNLIREKAIVGPNERAKTVRQAVRYIVAYATGDGQAIRASTGYGGLYTAAPPEGAGGHSPNVLTSH